MPQPLQQPYPPTRIAVASEDTFPMVGNLGHSIFISAAAGIPVLKERLQLYRTARHEAGFEGPGEVTLRIPVYVAETTAKAQEEPKESAMHAIQYAATELIKTAASEEGVERLRRTANIPYEEILQRRVMFGTPEEVTERLEEYREELDISGVVLETNYGGQIPNDRVMASVRLLTEKVLPSFK